MRIEHPAFQIRSAGTPNAGLILDVRTVVMPAAYAADGHPVDLSAAFSSVLAIQVLRAFVTATGAHDTRRYVPNEAGTDTYANRKFRVKAESVASHTHSIAVQAASSHDHGGLTTPGQTAASAICVVGCNQNHAGTGTHTHAIAEATLAAHDHGGASGAASPAFGELAGGTDLSTITVQYLVIGVPA